jgi:hypothetical protein
MQQFKSRCPDSVEQKSALAFSHPHLFFSALFTAGFAVQQGGEFHTKSQHLRQQSDGI